MTTIRASAGGPRALARWSATRARLTLAALNLLLALAFLAYLCIGEQLVPPDRVLAVLLDRPERILDRISVWEVRLPRALLATAAGAMLAVAGALLQLVTRNPLAAPELTGVSAGAVFVIVLFITLTGSTELAGWLPLVAAVGGFGAATVTYVFSVRRRRSDPERLILVGIVVSGVLSGAASFFLLNGDVVRVEPILRWLIGSLDLRSWDHVAVLWPYLIVALPLLAFAIPLVNVLQLGDDLTQNAGVGPERARVLTLVAAVMLTAAAVTVAGALAFVGFMAPHLARLTVGGDARRLVPASAYVGATLLLLSDLLARSFDPSWLFLDADAGYGTSGMPVGVVTALLGVPFFLYLLRRS